jgi:hypothetical protein
VAVGHIRVISYIKIKSNPRNIIRCKKTRRRKRENPKRTLIARVFRIQWKKINKAELNTINSRKTVSFPANSSIQCPPLTFFSTLLH